MFRVLRDCQRSRSACQEIEVIDIVARTSRHRMKSGTNENGVAVYGAKGDIARFIWRIQSLQRESFFGVIDPVIIDFIEINLSWRSMYVVFVRWVTRPVSSRSVHLNDHQFVSRRVRANDLDNLARSISTATEADGNIFWGNQQRLEFFVRGNATLGNFADGRGFKGDSVARGKIDAVGKSVEDVGAIANDRGAAAPILNATTQDHEGRFFTVRCCRKDFARIQTARNRAHPVPLDGIPRKADKLAGLAIR